MLFYKTTNLHQIRGFRFSWYFSLAFINTMHLMAITGFGLGIRFTKTWYLSHQENILLFKEKTRKEVHLQKSKSYPEIIKKSLATLSDNLSNNSEDSPEILMAISDVFSYLLYGVNEGYIEVKKEINVVKKIAFLENSIPDNSFLVTLVMTGIIGDDMLVQPMALFSILQSGIGVANEQKECANDLQLDLTITNDGVFVSIAFNSLSDSLSEGINWGEQFKSHIPLTKTSEAPIYRFEEVHNDFVKIFIGTVRKNVALENYGSELLTANQ
jgi:hypothetical protein